MAKKCSTNECTNKAHSAGLCSACYSWHWYHQNEGVAATQRYLKRMKRVQARIDSLSPPKRGGVSRPVRPPPRAQYAGRNGAYIN